MALYTGYVGAKNCTGGPTAGCKALMSWFLAAYKSKGARNDGIYNCRPIRGTSRTTSLHGEGRAADLGCHTGDAWAATLADTLRTHSKELGIQCVIYNRRIWSGAHPTAGWRSYGGSDPHTTHLHVELGWSAARSLTVARIRDVLTNGTSAPLPPAWKTAKYTRLLRYRHGHAMLHGPDVRRVQHKLGFTGKALDAIYGPKTANSVKTWQRQQRVKPVDGIVGPRTWKAMFG